jgi:hypothetical protein
LRFNAARDDGIVVRPADWRRPVPDLAERVTKLETEVKAIDVQVTQHFGEQFRLLSGAIKKVDARVTALHAKVVALDARVGALDHKVVALDGKVVALDRKVVALDHKVVALDRKVVALDGKVVALDRKVVALDGKVVAIDRKVGALDGKVVAIDRRLDRFERDVKAAFVVVDTRLTRIESRVGDFERPLGVIGPNIEELIRRTAPPSAPARPEP